MIIVKDSFQLANISVWKKTAEYLADEGLCQTDTNGGIWYDWTELSQSDDCVKIYDGLIDFVQN